MQICPLWIGTTRIKLADQTVNKAWLKVKQGLSLDTFNVMAKFNSSIEIQMKSTIAKGLRNKKLADLCVGNWFLEQSERLGLITLGDVTNSSLALLGGKSDFSYVWYEEVLLMRRKEGLLDSFQKRQM